MEMRSCAELTQRIKFEAHTKSSIHQDQIFEAALNEKCKWLVDTGMARNGAGVEGNSDKGTEWVVFSNPVQK